VTARVIRPGKHYHTFLLTLTGLLAEQIVAGEHISAQEFNDRIASLLAHSAQPHSLTSQPLMWQAWGYRLT